MEQFDEIERLFMQLQDAGNPPIPQSHLNDLNKRLDAFVPQTSGVNATTVRKTIAITAITAIAASLVYFAYHNLHVSEPESSLKNNIKTETNAHKINPNSPSSANASQTKSLETIATNQDLVSDNRLKDNMEQNKIVSDNHKKVESKRSKIVNASNTTALNTSKVPLFKLISDLNTTNQTLSENEEIAEIKYSVSYNLVSPTIYINLPKGLRFSYVNNILVVKGTPTNVYGKQSVSIKALANDVVDSVNFSITVVQKP